MPFDPCREWLGIDSVDLASPRKALGLGVDEAGEIAITRAAEARLAALRAIDPGPFRKAHAAIMARVMEARDALLNDSRGPADSGVGRPTAGFSSPPPPRSHAHRSTPFVPEPPPEGPPAAVSFVAEPDPAPLIHEPVVLKPAARKRPSIAGTVFSALLLLLAVSAAVGAYAWINWFPELAHRFSRRLSSSHAVPHPHDTHGEHESKPPEQKPVPAPSPDAESTAEMRASRRRQQAAEREARERERLVASPQQHQQQQQQRNDEAEAEASAAEMRRLEVEKLAQARSAVDRSLGEAHGAFRQRDFRAARQSLEVASREAGDDGALATRVDRWALLVDYASQLEEMQQRAIGSANEGREYTIGKRTIAIIEINATTFSYKEAGQIKRGPRAKMPRPIERAILAQWFEGDKRAANHIFLGVYDLLEDTPNLDRVRAEWLIALAGEPATKSIMPLLDDPILNGNR